MIVATHMVLEWDDDHFMDPLWSKHKIWLFNDPPYHMVTKVVSGQLFYKTQ